MNMNYTPQNARFTLFLLASYILKNKCMRPTSKKSARGLKQKTKMNAANIFLVQHSHTLVRPLQLGLWTPSLRCGLSRLGDGLPRFSVASRGCVMDSHASSWPLELGLWTPTLRCGPSSWGDGLPLFGVSSRVRVRE